MDTELLRGITSCSHIENGLATEQVFAFSKTPNVKGFHEESINWNSDEFAVFELIDRKNGDGATIFVGGVGIISIDRLKDYLRDHIMEGRFLYNHDPDPEHPENPYHGNLCVKSGTPTHAKKLIRNGLALVVGKNIIKKEDL